MAPVDCTVFAFCDGHIEAGKLVTLKEFAARQHLAPVEGVANLESVPFSGQDGNEMPGPVESHSRDGGKWDLWIKPG
jgi:hypothetical protein